MTPDLMEANALDYLWSEAAKGFERNRLDALNAMAAITIPRPADWDIAAVRAEALPRSIERQCFVCGDEDHWLYRHHAIQVQHGGSNSPRNLVKLCFSCHRKIHPWIEPALCEAKGWRRIGEQISGGIATVAKYAQAPENVSR